MHFVGTEVEVGLCFAVLLVLRDLGERLEAPLGVPGLLELGCALVHLLGEPPVLLHQGGVGFVMKLLVVALAAELLLNL